VKIVKTKIKHAITLLIAVLSITMLTGCPPTMPPVDKIAAKEAWEIMKSAQETISEDAVPVYIQGINVKPESPITEGKTGVWVVGFYSESENTVWEVQLNNNKNSEPTLSSAEEYYTDISLTVYDLADWNIDSTEACEIAVQNGAGNTQGMSLQIARSDNEDAAFIVHGFIPNSTKLFWVIKSDSYRYYIDACTGEYLGKYTSEQLRNME